VEHLALSEDFLMNLIQERVMKATATNDPRDLRAMDDKILGVIADRTFSAKAPEPVVPAGKFASPQAAMQHFLASRAKTLAFLANTPDLRAHVIESPLGKADAYQWLLFISAHTERHTKQLLETKADPKFPAR
ncbi:MAG: DinB family protein, partial [Gemmatimonadales bacterium]